MTTAAYLELGIAEPDTLHNCCCLLAAIVFVLLANYLQPMGELEIRPSLTGLVQELIGCTGILRCTSLELARTVVDCSCSGRKVFDRLSS